MRVADLIAELKKLPPNTEVLVRGLEGGYCYARPRTVRVAFDVNKNVEYEGPHEKADIVQDLPFAPSAIRIETAVVIHSSKES